jgi:UDP-N-acetylmuramoyl-tripeptide--D-alanyl-D-alanine ligase
VHLERFKTEEAIVVAKAEITQSAHTVVLNVDDARLAELADQLTEAGGKLVVRCSAQDMTADVAVQAGPGSVSVYVAGVRIAADVILPRSVQPTNLACSLAVAFALGVPRDVAISRIDGLPPVPNRLHAAQAASGIWVIDDTFNSNPSGARAALAELARLPVTGRRVVVTPGMVELGSRQFDENRAFAEAVAQVATDLIIVGRTNHGALQAGASPLRPRCVRTRDEAVAWVRATLGAGDAVLYENDLPDHYR